MIEKGRCGACGGQLRPPPPDADDEDLQLLARFCSIHCYHYGALVAAAHHASDPLTH
ncbi:MAG TPA: hypothetical protein VM889_07700 [Candidatus Thermoplasmatota archaeon]|nr:hypothetical protein [Candidatus Thermoplasmatota archaeon]